MIYSIDFETRSKAELKDVGLDIYANDPTTEVLCIAFGTQPNNVVVKKPEPIEHWDLLLHVKEGGKIAAWNAMFEYAIWNCVCVPKYGWPPLKLEQCIDTMAIAASNNVPQALDDAGQLLDAKYQKDPIGKRLIQKLCKPNKKGEFINDPELLSQLFEYCAQDVRTEMAIGSVLKPLTAHEMEVWYLTQRINLRGVPVAPNELQNAVLAVQRAQGALDDELLALTGCKPSERAKLLGWLNAQGADMTNMTAETVSAMLARNNLKPKVRRALELRQEGSQTSVAKYAKMLEIQRDGKIRNTLVYHGASTGRWASRGGLNLQNIARPTISDDEIERAIPKVFVEGIGNMRDLASLVRSAIVAPTGKTFVDVDFSSIENRVGVYLAGQTDKVELFRKGLDEYKTFASSALYNIPYEEVTKDQRQIAKSAVLGCMFGQGAKGLVAYAEGMGVRLTEIQSQNAVNAYRTDYKRVKTFWYECQSAAIQAIKQPGDMQSAFEGRVEFDKNWDLNGMATKPAKLSFLYAKDVLWMKLPSGRFICWRDPKVEDQLTPRGDMREGITVVNQNTFTRKWGRNPLIGSSIFQSAVQGTARDMLAEACLLLEKNDFEVLNLIHDEVLMLVDESQAESALDHVVKLMTTPPKWAKDFPLAAEGWVGKRYRK
jgi:DNA polymerase